MASKVTRCPVGKVSTWAPLHSDFYDGYFDLQCRIKRNTNTWADEAGVVLCILYRGAMRSDRRRGGWKTVPMIPAS